MSGGIAVLTTDVSNSTWWILRSTRCASELQNNSIGDSGLSTQRGNPARWRPGSSEGRLTCVDNAVLDVSVELARKQINLGQLRTPAVVPAPDERIFVFSPGRPRR